MKIKAFGKVNLGLKVFKKTSEKKHELDSILYLCKNIYDIIDIKKDDRTSVTYFYKNQKIKIENCLVTKTLNYMFDKYGLDTSYRINIKKQIPLGAGLGGGSADAAAIINFLIKDNKINLDLCDIAINLGSDIPFFLSKLPIARVKHYGEYVCPIFNWQPKIKLHINNVFVSTKKIFSLLDSDPFYKSRADIDTIVKNNIYKQHLNVVYNDLTKYIIQSDKQLEDLFDEFKGYGWFTGAGSTIVTLED